MAIALFKSHSDHRIVALTFMMNTANGAMTMVITSGHDEPSMGFNSRVTHSGNNVQWEFTLPRERPVPATQSFENFITFWVSMALCDPNSGFVRGPCIPDSDKNDPRAGWVRVSRDAVLSSRESSVHHSNQLRLNPMVCVIAYQQSREHG